MKNQMMTRMNKAVSLTLLLAIFFTQVIPAGFAESIKELLPPDLNQAQPATDVKNVVAPELIPPDQIPSGTWVPAGALSPATPELKSAENKSPEAKTVQDIAVWAPLTPVAVTDPKTGKVIEQDWKDKDGKVIWSFQYGRDGKLAYLQHFIYSADGNFFQIDEYVDGKISYTTHYDEQGRTSKWESFNADGTLSQSGTYTYNDQGRLSHLETRDAAGTLMYTQDYAYDASGYLNKIEGFDHRSGSPVLQWRQICDEKGWVQKITYFDSHGAVRSEDRYFFDEKGRMSHIDTFDGKNQQTGSSQYHYDISGNLSDIEYTVFQDGTLHLQNRSVYQDGEWSKTIYFDLLGNMVSEQRPDGSSLQYLYESKDPKTMTGMVVIRPDGTKITVDFNGQTNVDPYAVEAVLIDLLNRKDNGIKNGEKVIVRDFKIVPVRCIAMVGARCDSKFQLDLESSTTRYSYGVAGIHKSGFVPTSYEPVAK